ncbi:MAG: ABC transporter permease [Candidatus Delongbacteria bacterium]|nr:ABC transporter permease [Candidatus Delongbacteria bacterium]
MVLKIYLIQFINDLRHQKLRAFLTLFGLIWGTTAIMLLLSIGEAMQSQMYKSMHGMGERIIIVWPGKTSLTYRGFPKGRDISFYPDDITYLRSVVPEIESISGECRSWGSPKVRYKDKELTLDLIGVEPVWAEMRNVIPQQGGRFIHPDDMEHKRRVVFIGDRLKENIFGQEEALGRYITIDNTPFQVIGVMTPKIQNSSYSGRDHSKAIIPLSSLMLMYNRKTLNNLIVQPRIGDPDSACMHAITIAFSRSKQFDPVDDDALGDWDTRDMDKFVGNFTLGLKLFLGLVGGFTLVVAGIGVANIMNVIVEERTREIGIKMALGIRKRMVMWQFLFETFMLTFIGGLIGYLISAGLCGMMNLFKIEDFMGHPSVTLGVGIISTVILGLVALMAGYFPAKRAAGLNPVEALRW